MSDVQPLLSGNADALYEPFAVAHALGRPLDAPAGSRVYSLVIDSEADTLLERIFCRMDDVHQAVVAYMRSHMLLYHSSFTPICPTCDKRGFWRPEGKIGTPSYQCVTGHVWTPAEIANPESLTFETAKDFLSSAGVYVSISNHIL